MHEFKVTWMYKICEFMINPVQSLMLLNHMTQNLQGVLTVLLDLLSCSLKEWQNAITTTLQTYACSLTLTTVVASQLRAMIMKIRKVLGLSNTTNYAMIKIPGMCIMVHYKIKMKNCTNS